MSRTPRPFAALFWKEMIELTRYSAPIFVLYAVFTWMDTKPPSTIQDVVHPAERFVWFALFNGLVGLVMGFYQTWRESHVDAWAFAVHRPVTRNRIFLAKMLAGQATLLIVAGLPYAVAMIWTAMPGHVAVPFDINMWQPGIADLLNGLVFHAAGLFVGARHGSVIVRSLGVVAAISSAVVMGTAQTLGWAMVPSVIMGLLLLLGAWATFVSRDDADAQPWAGRVANVLILVPACLAIYIVGAFWFGFTADEDFPPVARHAPGLATITPDGELARITVREELERGGQEQTYVATVADLEGRPRPDLTARLAGKLAGSGVLVTSHVQLDRGAFNHRYRSPSRWVQRLFAGMGGPIWYFERRHRLISVYDDSTRKRIGWIGPDGFLAGDTMPARRFEGDLRQSDYTSSGHLLFSGAIYTAEFPAVPRLFFRAPEGDTIADISWPGYRPFNKLGYTTRTPWSHFLAVTTNRTVYVLDDSGRVEVSTPHPVQRGRWSSVTVWRAPNAPGKPTFVWYPAAADSLHRVFEYHQGSLGPTASHQFTGEMFLPDNARSSGQLVALRSQSSGTVAMPIPAAQMVFGGIEIRSASEAQRPTTRATLTMLAWSAISMLAMWLVGRRYGLTKGWLAFWLFVALAGGPFALLLLWLTENRPARERCPACGKMRVVNRERCEHCDAPFTAPEPDGTEIFAMTRA
jgi:hypothetical protein